MFLFVITFLAYSLVAGGELDRQPASRQSSVAWWVNWSLAPSATEIEGIAIRTIDRTWRRASVIRASDLPPGAQQRGERLEDFGFALSVDADFNRHRRTDRAVVGVFETTAGEFGRFLLLLGRRNGSDRWTKQALFTVNGAADFSAVAFKDGQLEWVGCFECDDFCTVIRRFGRYRLRCENCCPR